MMNLINQITADHISKLLVLKLLETISSLDKPTFRTPYPSLLLTPPPIMLDSPQLEEARCLGKNLKHTSIHVGQLYLQLYVKNFYTCQHANNWQENFLYRLHRTPSFCTCLIAHWVITRGMEDWNTNSSIWVHCKQIISYLPIKLEIKIQIEVHNFLLIVHIKPKPSIKTIFLLPLGWNISETNFIFGGLSG